MDEIDKLKANVFSYAKDNKIKELEEAINSCDKVSRKSLEEIPGHDSAKYCDVKDYVLNSPSKDGNDIITTPVVIAARKGHQELVRCLLKKHNVCVEQTGMVEFPGHPIIRGATPLWCAASIGNLEMTKMLIEEFGAEVDHPTVTNSTPLRPACFDGFLKVVEYLISKGASVNIATKCYNNTCLLISSYNGHADVVKFLLEHGAEVETRDFLGQTALHNAAEKGHLDIVEQLLSHGARFTADKKNITPLHVACEFSQVRVMEYFLSADATLFSKVDRVHANELLGASFANGSSNYDMQRCFKYLKEAMTTRCLEAGPEMLKQVKPPEEVFDHQVECQTLEELEAIENDEDKLNVEALLVRERILGRYNTNTIDLVYRGAVLADRRNYTSCIKYWARAIDVKRYNDESIAQDLERYGELFSEMIENSYATDLQLMLSTLRMCVEEIKVDKRRLSIKTHDSELAKVRKSIRTNSYTALFLVAAILNQSECESVNFDTRKLVYQLVKINPVLPGNSCSTLLHVVCDHETEMNEYFVLELVDCPNSLLLKVLLECGMDPDVADSAENTALHVLCKEKSVRSEQKHASCIKILLQRGAHVDLSNSKGERPIDYHNYEELLLPVMLQRPLKCIAAELVKKRKLPYRGKVPSNLELLLDRH